MSSALIKGTVFELNVSRKLSELSRCMFLSNFKVYSHYLGKYTEIDRLLFTPWDIYCIEAKSFNTSLEGKFNDNSWIGRSGRRSTTIYNPVFQNFEHIRSLNSALRGVGSRPL